MKVPALTCELSGEGCNDKEKEYVESYKSKSADDVAKEIARLTKMKNGKMKPELVQWIQQRISILQQLNSGAGDKTEL